MDGLKRVNAVNNTLDLVTSQAVYINLNYKANISHIMIPGGSSADLALGENRNMIIMGSWWDYGGLLVYVTKGWGNAIKVNGLNGSNYVSITNVDSDTIRLANGTNETLIASVIS